MPTKVKTPTSIKSPLAKIKVHLEQDHGVIFEGARFFIFCHDHQKLSTSTIKVKNHLFTPHTPLNRIRIKDLTFTIESQKVAQTSLRYIYHRNWYSRSRISGLDPPKPLHPFLKTSPTPLDFLLFRPFDRLNHTPTPLNIPSQVRTWLPLSNQPKSKTLPYFHKSHLVIL